MKLIVHGKKFMIKNDVVLHDGISKFRIYGDFIPYKVSEYFVLKKSVEAVYLSLLYIDFRE